MSFPFRHKTLEEIAEDTERLRVEAENEDLQLTIAQKQALRRKLADAGLSVNKTFGGSLRAAWRWAFKRMGEK